MTLKEIAALVDHTALKPETTPKQIEQLCREARENEFASVCVNSVYVSMVSRFLEGTKVKTCSVVGFPLGACTTPTKLAETREAIRFGAREIDMVLWVGGMKSGQFEWVEADIRALVDFCNENNALLKVIFECCLLTEDEKKRACDLSISAGAHFLKTSTGFSSGGATVEDIRLMSNAAKSVGIGVKASGGVRSYADVMKMVEAGATRIGTSSGVKIIEEAREAHRG